MKEQKKPTTKRYLIRNVLLLVTLSTGILSIVGNIAYSIIESVIF